MSSENQTTQNSPDAYLYIQPDIRRNRVAIHVTCPEDAEVSLEIPELGITQPGQPGKNLITLESYEQWTPSSPTLYSLKASIGPDIELITTFAMREFSVKENRFFLNNRPLYVKGIDCTDWSPEACIKHAQDAITSLKHSGFNLIRVAPNALGITLIDLADQSGLLVEVYIEKKVDLASVTALRNHACIVAWDFIAYQGCDPDEIHQIDPSRLVYFRDPESGFIQLRRPYRDDAQDADFFAIDHGLAPRRSTTNYFAHLGHPEVISYARTLTVRQLALDDATTESLESDIQSRELERIFTSPSEFASQADSLRQRTLCRIIDPLRTNTSVAGYCISGCAPNDATRASTYQDLGAGQGQTHLMIQLAQNNLVPRQETPVKVFFLNEDKLEGRADLSLQVVGPTNQVLWKKKRGVRLPKSGKLIWEGAIAASGSAGPHKFVVRLMQNMQRIAEASINVYVYPPAQPLDKAINLLDPNGVYKSACEALVPRFEFTAPVHVIPPLANTIRAYPDNDLAQILGQVNAGSVAIFFQPPADWNDLASLIDSTLQATPRDTSNTGELAVSYARLHPTFDELPSRCLIGETYSGIIARTAFLESSDEDISASFCQVESNSDWSSNVLVKRYGSGRLVFVALSIMQRLGTDPVADHLFVNLVKHFRRRSIPSAEGTLAVHQSSVEWLRQQRKECTRTWAVIGMFPYCPWNARVPTYAPQESVDLAGTYPGWYDAISWKMVHATQPEKFRVDLDQSLAPEFVSAPTGDFGIAYAYAEIHGDARGEMFMVPKSTCPLEIYLNDALVHSPESDEARPTVYIKQGKNSLLVKIYKQPGPCSFSLDLEAASIPIKFRWWR